MSNITYHLLWPGGNGTAIVETRVDRGDQPRVANTIMAVDPWIEQVGFLEKPHSPKALFRLQMMGGEFCGNAARAAAFLWARNHKNVKQAEFEVSGFEGVLSARLTPRTALLELPGYFFKAIQQTPDGTVVDLMGIRHVVSVQKPMPPPELIKRYGKDCEAMGIITVSHSKKDISLKPTVWVRQTNTCIKETGCASGSIAVALALRNDRFPKRRLFRLKQPSGKTYEVRLRFQSGMLESISLKGVIGYRGRKTIRG